ncbi:MAG: hypothetical protein ACRC4L_02380 [Mycoplasma sp.]
MFRKNKISEAIKNAENDSIKDGRFDSLSELNNKFKENKFTQKLFVQPYQLAANNISDKAKRYSSYISSKKYPIIKISYFAILIAIFVIASIMAFMPYQASNVGFYLSNITNFYTAYISNNNVMFLLTPLACAFFGLILLQIIVTPFFIKYLKSQNKWKVYSCHEAKVANYLFIVILAITFCLLLSAFIIPPSKSILTLNQSVHNQLAIYNDSLATDDIKAAAAVELYKLFKLTPPVGTAAEIIKQFDIDYLNLKFSLPTTFGSQYSFIFNNSLNALGTINHITIIYYIIFAILSFTLVILIPTAVILFNTKEYVELNDGPNPEWNTIYNVMFWIIKPKTRKQKEKIDKTQKTTYRQYINKIGDHGLLKNDESNFSTLQTDNSINNITTKNEIESHAPNKAFLNKEGDWMYHDGNGKYFIARNDVWTPYEIDAAVHKAFVDRANDELELDPSKKQAKKSFLDERFNKKNKNKSSIELPDDGLDEILKKLDI